VAVLLFAVGWGANHFASLLQVYKHRLALDAAAPTILFGVYALGLMPGLLLAGPLSDRLGRRAIVVPAALVALVASGVLGAFGHSFYALLAGRFLYGLGAGAVTSPGSVWLFELSQDAAAGNASGNAIGNASGNAIGARRAAISLSAGFGLGPLVTGVLAQFAPAPTVLPFVAHAAMLSFAIARVWGVRDVAAKTARAAGERARLLRFDLDGAGWRRFLTTVAPMAPWVFAFPCIAFAVLPSLLGGSLGPWPIAYTGLIGAITLGSGVVAQPLTRSLEPTSAARRGLALGVLGLLLGAFAVAAAVPLLLLAVAPLLGGAYGICLTAGLRSAQAIAPAHARGGLTGLYYVLTYLGFAAPTLFALAGRRSGAPQWSLLATAALAALVAMMLRPAKTS
jgi:MFS family permease